jgi:hypothetical protein
MGLSGILLVSTSAASKLLPFVTLFLLQSVPLLNQHSLNKDSDVEPVSGSFNYVSFVVMPLF